MSIVVGSLRSSTRIIRCVVTVDASRTGWCSSTSSTPRPDPGLIQVGKRWVVERTNSWMNGYGKLRRCTEHNDKIVDFYLYRAAALLTVRRLMQRARTLYRWDTDPPSGA